MQNINNLLLSSSPSPDILGSYSKVGPVIGPIQHEASRIGHWTHICVIQVSFFFPLYLALARFD
jgi:hypothetical protein